MNRFTLFTVALMTLLLCFSNQTQAQNKGFYIGAGIGYDNPFNTDSGFGYEYNETQVDTVPFIIRGDLINKPGTAGRGINAGLQLGYMFNEHFGIELNSYYFLTPDYIVSDSTQTNVDGSTSFYTTKSGGYQIRLAPALVVKGGDGKFSPYAKFGIVAPIAGVVTAKRTSNDAVFVNPGLNILGLGHTETPEDFDLEAEFEGKFSLGIESSFGVNFELSDNLTLFGELNYVGLRVKRNKATVTKANVTMSDGEVIDVRPVLNIGGVQAYTEFFDEVDVGQRDLDLQEEGQFELPGGSSIGYPLLGSSEDNPYPHVDSQGSYNSLGINIGIKFSFGDKE